MREFDYDTEAALAMAQKEWEFALNRQMKPLRCVISAVHLYKDRPKFDIDLNVDSGADGDDTLHTRLQNVGAQFLYPLSGVHPIFEPILKSIDPSK